VHGHRRSIARRGPAEARGTWSDDGAHALCLLASLLEQDRSQACCALYCLWVRRILDADLDARTSAVATLRGLYGDTELRAAIEEHVRPDDAPGGSGSGYVVDTLRTVRGVMRQSSYERVVREAIGHGRDTDTTACIAGGLAGAREGVAAIPERWLLALRGRELAEPLIEALVARRIRQATPAAL
jgi:ADP-ribosyl-[dinitrogen reductase] hydrolase